jgi:putative ABC transport system permease protein
MKRLFGISLKFLKRSKVLTLSCIFSIITATVLILLLSNFSISLRQGYEKNTIETYGDYNLILTYEDYRDVESGLVDEIKKVRGIKDIAIGRTSNLLVIDNNYVYGLGVKDSDIIKSRYHYTTSLDQNQVIINEVLKEVLQCEIGEDITILNKPIQVVEVIKDSEISSSRVPIAIVDMETLHNITGEGNLPNFILVKFADGVKYEVVQKELFFMEPNFKVTVLEQDDFYKNTISSYNTYITLLNGAVLLVTILFLGSVFRGYFYKYQHDMAIIRAIGGNKKQVGFMYLLLGSIPSGVGCVLGYLISILLHHTVLDAIYADTFFKDITVTFSYMTSMFLAVGIFLVILLTFCISVQKVTGVLPIQALYQNEMMLVGKRNTTKFEESKKSQKVRKKILKKILVKILPKDIFLSIRLLAAKMRENQLIVLTIIMLVVISFVGSSLSTIIKHNNGNYLKSQYLTNIVATTSNMLTYKESMDIYNNVQKDSEFLSSIVLVNGGPITINDNPATYALADIDAMKKQGIIGNHITSKEQMILSDSMAKKLGVEIGDSVQVVTPKVMKRDAYGNPVGVEKLPNEHTLIVADIIEKEKLNYLDGYVDITLDDFRQEHMGLRYLYVSGNLSNGKEVLEQIKEEYPGFIWSSYDDMLKNSNEIIEERYEIFQFVTVALIIIAGIGWFHSMRNMIISRRRDYHIMRIQGVIPIRLCKVIGYQLIAYLMVGLGIGGLIGYGILQGLVLLEGGNTMISLDFTTSAVLAVYLLVLGVLLTPLVYRISKEKISINGEL